MTDQQGQVTVNLTSLKAQTFPITAEYKAVQRSVEVTFIADNSTAILASLTETGSPAIANGSSGVVVTATLTDSNGNPLPKQPLNFSGSANLSIIQSSSNTDNKRPGYSHGDQHPGRYVPGFCAVSGANLFHRYYLQS